MFTLFLALSLHAAIILGVGFVWQVQQAASPTIEITLAQHSEEKAPEKADFIAQANQSGSGNAEQAIEKTTTSSADFHANEFKDVLTEAIQTQPQEAPLETPPSITTAFSADRAMPVQERKPETEPFEALNAQKDAKLNLSRDIASIEARLDRELQADAKGPRIRRLTSVSARSTVDAYYLQSWRRKVETVGNLNYPDEARRKHLFGNLRLLVSITPDGGLKDVLVLESSGHKVLDDAAVRIVRLAAPFAPFPPEMRDSTDVLEIIRTWQFRKSGYSSS